MTISTESIRNIALAGHAGAGKTSLLEAILVAVGVLGKAGTIERGNTFSDFDPLEKQHGHSTDAAMATIEHGHCRLHIVDTPGYADFRGPTLAALSAVETCAVVINAANGIEHGARRMLHYAGECGLARILVINHMDAESTDLHALVRQLRDEFGSQCLPVNLPVAGGSSVADCFFSPGEDSDLGPAADWHQQIIDQVVEINESIMGRYLEQGEESLQGQELHDAFEQCLREGHLIPICFTNARTGVGVAEWLDVATRLLPNPAEGTPPPLVRGEGDNALPVIAQPDADQPVIANVFRIANDPFAGKLGIFRVYQGTLRKDSQLYIDDSRKAFKVSHLFRINGKHHETIDTAIPGDIAAIAKVEDLHFNAILHDSHDADHIHLHAVSGPQPMFGLAVRPEHKGQEQKLANALTRLAEEDPCLRIEHHRELNETVVFGLGELHLKIALERMQDRYGVTTHTAPPRIAYRETISASAEGQHRHKKQTGGAGQFGEVSLRVEPLPRGKGFQFVDQVKGGAIPGQFLPAVEKGVRQAMTEGSLAGYPMQDLRVIVLDGKHHPVDSKEVAFIAAGKKAFQDAVSKAKPTILEPIVHIRVRLPEPCVGDVTGGLANRRARIMGTDTLEDDLLEIQAQVPQAELEGFQAELKAMTGGSGRYSVEPGHYEQVPPQLRKALLESTSNDKG